MSSESIDKPSTIKVVFSDVDGTLAHYPDSISDINNSNDNGNRILKLPPSATGMQGIISSQTLAKCQEIRSTGTKLVLVSGMRTSTLLKRLPFLPKADAYCSEAGGRIFISRSPSSKAVGSEKKALPFTVVTEPYDGATPKDLEPFEIVEDQEWRRRMEDKNAAGTDGYLGAELDCLSSTKAAQDIIPVADREGELWEFARQLAAKGFVLDTKGYATCFRVNRKQQGNDVSDEDFERLLTGQVLACPPELATSTNLGCIDYYPVESGKKNCCRYVAGKFLNSDETTAINGDVLSNHCVCLCDDDNDLEMAMACHHAFIPGISSTSMADIIANNPNQFSQTGGDAKDHDGLEGTIATEKALSLVLQRLGKLS